MALSVSCSFFFFFSFTGPHALLFTLLLSILVLDWKNERDGARIGRSGAGCHVISLFSLWVCWPGMTSTRTFFSFFFLLRRNRMISITQDITHCTIAPTGATDIILPVVVCEHSLAYTFTPLISTPSILPFPFLPCPALFLFSFPLVFACLFPHSYFFWRTSTLSSVCSLTSPHLFLLFTAPIPLFSLTPRNPPISILPGNSIKGPAFPSSSFFFFLFFISTIIPYYCSIGPPSLCPLFRFSLLLSPPFTPPPLFISSPLSLLRHFLDQPGEYKEEAHSVIHSLTHSFIHNYHYPLSSLHSFIHSSILLVQPEPYNCDTPPIHIPTFTLSNNRTGNQEWRSPGQEGLLSC